MGKAQRDKGYRGERKIVQAHKEQGIDCYRVPLSGATERHKGDIVVQYHPTMPQYVGEVKWRESATGWTAVKTWLGNNDFLFLIEDNTEPLVVMSLTKYFELIKLVERYR